MLEVSIETLLVAMPPAPSVVVLRPPIEAGANEQTEKYVLPIWIGPSEAASIGVALEHHTQERPMTHDLLANTIYALGATVERVVIDRVNGSTFYATVYLSREGRTLNIDARPSDAIALALRMKAPLFVDEDVMNVASHQFSLKGNKGHSAPLNTEGAVDEFRSFLDSITPEDFTVEG